MKVKDLIEILQKQDPEALLVTDLDTGYEMVLPNEMCMITECFPVELSLTNSTIYDVTNKHSKYKEKLEILRGIYIG